MRKEEMSATQLAERLQTIDLLTANGWSVTDAGDWFEKGLWADREANLLYENSDGEIHACYSASKRSIFLMVEDDLGRNIEIQLSYEERLVPTLEALIGMQEALSTLTYKTLFDGLIDACPRVYAWSDEASRMVELEANPADPSKQD